MDPNLEWDQVKKDPNFCGGPNACEKREYDPSKEDCKVCMDELDKIYAQLDPNEP